MPTEVPGHRSQPAPQCRPHTGHARPIGLHRPSRAAIARPLFHPAYPQRPSRFKMQRCFASGVVRSLITA